MPCSCFLPSCVVCQPPREADLQCSCKLPSCRQCFPEEQELSTISLTGKGRPASPEAEAIIAAVDHRLRKMLARCKVPAYLVAGPDFASLPIREADIGKTTGSRHDHLVAFLCNVGVRAVQTARCSAAPAAPRGRKRLSSSGGREEEHGAAPTALPAAHGDEGVGADIKILPGVTTLAGVRGTFVMASQQNAEEHAIALVLGRLYLFSSLNAIPQRAIRSLLAQMSLAGAPVGQKYHHAQTVRAFTGIAARLCQRATSASFWRPPPNLPHPSAWRLVFDGVTLRNGATVTMVLVVFTDADGAIIVKFLGCIRDAMPAQGLPPRGKLCLCCRTSFRCWTRQKIVLTCVQQVACLCRVTGPAREQSGSQQSTSTGRTAAIQEITQMLSFLRHLASMDCSVPKGGLAWRTSSIATTARRRKAAGQAGSARHVGGHLRSPTVLRPLPAALPRTGTGLLLLGTWTPG